MDVRFAALSLFVVVCVILVTGCSDAAKKVSVVRLPNVAVGDHVNTYRNSRVVIDVFADAKSPRQITKVGEGSLGQAALLEVEGRSLLEYIPKENSPGVDIIDILSKSAGGAEQPSKVTIVINPWTKPSVAGKGSKLHLTNNGIDKTHVFWVDGNTIMNNQFVERKSWSGSTPVYTAPAGNSIQKTIFKQNRLGDVFGAWSETKATPDTAEVYIGVLRGKRWTNTVHPAHAGTSQNNINISLAINDRDKPSLLWQNTSLQWSMFKYGSWDATSDLNPSMEKAVDLVSASDSYDHTVAVWRQNSEHDLWWAHNDGAVWTAENIDNNLDSEIKPVLRFTGNGNGIIVYVRVNEPVWEVVMVPFSSNPQTAPSAFVPEVIGQHNMPIIGLSATLVDSGDRAIAWIQTESSGSSVRLFRDKGGNRQTETVNGDNSTNPDFLAMDMNRGATVSVIWHDNKSIYSRQLGQNMGPTLRLAETALSADHAMEIVTDENGNAVAAWINTIHNIVSSDFCLSSDLCGAAIPDHNSISEPCISCHDGAIATSPWSRIHQTDSAICDDCHEVATWRMNSASHGKTKLTENCNTCHDHETGRGSTAGHFAATAVCVDCHQYSDGWLVHGKTGSACAACHNNVIATGTLTNRSVIHFKTTEICETCHTNYVSWSYLKYQHTNRYYIPHRAVPCGSCHLQNEPTIVPPFQGYGLICAGCHANAFAPNFHTGTLAQFLDCGACHFSTAGW